MFANLKNKIREETGGDLPQLGPKHHGHGRLSRGSKGGSTSSMCSEQDTSALKPKVDWQLKADTLTCEKAVLEEEKAELVKKNLELAEQLKDANNYKQKAIQYQEDLDQLEGFQSQEIAKVKHLLLEREQQLTESKSSLAKAQTEISRLRSIQDELANLQDSLEAARHNAEQTRVKLVAQLEEGEAERRLLTEKLTAATALLEASARGDVGAELERAKELAERRLEEARLELADVKAKWCQQVTALETQVARLSVQAGEEGVERRAAEKSLEEALGRLATLTLERDAALERAVQEEKSGEHESALREQISSLEAAKLELEGRCTSLEGAAEEKQRLHEAAEERGRTLEQRLAELEAAAELARAAAARQHELEAALKKAEAVAAERQTQLEQAATAQKAALAEKAEKSKQLEQLENENKALRLCSEHVGQVEAEKKVLVDRCVQLEANQRNTELEDTLQNTISRLEGEGSLLSERLRSLEEKASRSEQELKDAHSERDQLLLRNASLSQQGELNCRELQEEIKELKASIAKQAPKSQVDELNTKISNLEEQLAEKNKSVKVLTQRLSDMKKTLQKEMKTSDGAPVQPPAQTVTNLDGTTSVNHEYLKHVVLKFFTSREYEAQHLTKAVATVLNLTPEEERLLKETLDWKMSWFGGSKPSLKQVHPSKPS